MKATGVIRKLDDLGRLVIPKEIRKQYGLKEGDSIEFYIEEDKIIIQKYDTLSKYIREIRMMCETLETMLNTTILFIHDDKNCIFKQQPKEIFIRSIRQVRKAIEFRNELIYEDDQNTYNGKVYPVIANSETLGAFVIVYNQQAPSNSDLKTIEAFVQLLTRQHQ